MIEITEPRVSSLLLTSEEVAYLFDYINNLKAAQIRRLFKQHGIPSSGTKPALRERLRRELREGNIEYIDLIRYIETIAPWDKQHVFLFEGPVSQNKQLDYWRSPIHFHRLIESNHLLDCLQRSLPIVLPERMTIFSIEHSQQRLRVLAVERWESWDHDKTKDYDTEIEGQLVRYKAYLKYVARGLFIFEWDFVSNLAWLQVSQISASSSTYDKVKKQFGELVKKWLPLDLFEPLDLRPAIGNFHVMEQQAIRETRSYKLAYTLPTGTRLEARSAMTQQPVIDDETANDALDKARLGGVGHSGNIYFLPNQEKEDPPLANEVHVYLLANQHRVNFPTANTEKVVRYVLQRIQAACRRIPRLGERSKSR